MRRLDEGVELRPRRAAVEAPRRDAEAVGEGDREWRFVPADAWRAGSHDLVVLTILEDSAGNRVGRPFEIEMFTSKRSDDRESVAVEFVVK